jgi:hypothetical protein
VNELERILGGNGYELIELLPRPLSIDTVKRNRNLSKRSWRPNWNSNQATPAYKSISLAIQHSARLNFHYIN